MPETDTPAPVLPIAAPEPPPSPPDLTAAPPSPAPSVLSPQAPPATARREWPAPLRRLWRSRVALAGLLAIVLALWGEELMRGPADHPNPQAALGANLMRVAVLLVGVVAWVREGWRLRGQTAAAEAPAPPVPTSLPVRRPDADTIRVAGTRRSRAPRSVPEVVRAGLARAGAFRTQLGWPGTVIGLLIVVALAGWCLLLLNQKFDDPRAPWVWLAALIALTVTFLGLEPRQADPSLVTHDPGEPPAPPAMTRGEWLAIGAILLVATILRVWNLDAIPLGPYTDEGDRAIDARHINRGELVEQAPFLFFGTGWWGVPSLYFWVVAQSLKAFGDNLTGARMIHAIAGIATVWYTYRLGRAVWSPRVGLVAAALLTVSDFAIQFSRTAGESTIMILTWTACFYYLYRALQTRRPLDFVLSGLAGGFTLYSYAAGKLLPVFLALAALYILLRWGRTGIRRYLPGLVLLALTAALVYAPNGLYVLQHPDQLTMRSDGVSIFSPNNANQARGAYNTDNWGVILAQQFALTYSAFDVGQERGPFYPTHQPILPVPWAALWLLGTAYLVWRLGDVRFALLGIWLLGGLAGAALTNDTPTLQRVAAMVPLLALLPAIFLDRVAAGIPPIRWGIRLPARARVTRWAMGGLTVLLVLVFALQALSFYFGPYTAAANYYWYTLAGRYAEKLDPLHNAIYQMDIPEFFWWGGPALFLAKDVQGRDLVNVADEMPFTADGGKNAHFLLFPSNQQYLPILETYYPGGQTHIVNRPDGSLFFTAYEVDTAQFDAQRHIRARYGAPGGPLFERQEARLGTLAADSETTPALRPPDGLNYPLSAEWIGGLRVPAYGIYRLNLTAPNGAGLTIDGRAVLTATAASSTPAETQLVLAAGVHEVRLAGTLNDPQTPVELRWSTNTGQYVPISPAFLWGGTQGSLLGQAFVGAPEDNWLNDPHPPPPAGQVLVERRDGVLGWRSLADKLNGASIAVWRGTLHITTAGAYGFQAVTPGRASIWVDGQNLGGANGLQLTAGDHTFEVRVQILQQSTPFDVMWTPPGGQPAVIPPSAFSPATGGVYTVDERPGVSSPDPATIAAAPPVLPVRVAGEIKGDWKQARGVAVLPDGRVVVADTGNHRLVVYGRDGQQQATWGSAGAGDGHFDLLADVAASPDGLLAALDAGNRDVQIFDGNGSLQNHPTHDQLGIQSSSGITWGPNGQIYIADTAGARVVRSTRDGQQVAAFQAGDGQHAALDQATDVVVTPDGTIYAVDLRGRVVRFNKSGLIDREWTVPAGSTQGGSHLTLWGSYIVITNPDANSLALIDLTTSTLHQLQVSGVPLSLSLPIGIAAGPDNRLYVLDSGNNRVVVLEAVQ